MDSIKNFFEKLFFALMIVAAFAALPMHLWMKANQMPTEGGVVMDVIVWVPWVIAILAAAVAYIPVVLFKIFKREREGANRGS